MLNFDFSIVSAAEHLIIQQLINCDSDYTRYFFFFSGCYKRESIGSIGTRQLREVLLRTRTFKQ